jgi:hypothetical protein
MRVFLIRLTKFFLFSVLIIPIGIFMWGSLIPKNLKPNINYTKGTSGYMHTRINELLDYGQVDVVVLGSSHAYRGFDPRIFKEENISLFNLGSSAQTPIQTEMLVNKYIEKLRPKIVIYEVYPKMFEIDGVESALGIISNDVSSDIHMAKMVLRTNNLKVYNTFIYGSLRKLFKLDKEFNENKINGLNEYIEGGFVERKNENNNKNIVKLKNEKKKWTFRESQMKAFEKTLGNLSLMGVEILIIQNPISEELYNSYINNAEIDNYFMSTDKKYYNLNEVLKLSSSSHFYDSNHLTQEGVEVVNRKLIDLLKSDGIF